MKRDDGTTTKQPRQGDILRQAANPKRVSDAPLLGTRTTATAYICVFSHHSHEEQ